MAFLRIPIAFFRLEELFLNVFFNSGEYVGLISFTSLNEFVRGIHSVEVEGCEKSFGGEIKVDSGDDLDITTVDRKCPFGKPA